MELGRSRQPMRRRAGLAFVVVAIVVGALWLVADRGGSGPADLTLARLSFGQEDYDGEHVRTGGVVRRFGPEDGATRLHFVIEDADANRVELRGGDPA